MSKNNSFYDKVNIQDFKDLFFRDFLYANTWSIFSVYSKGDVVLYGKVFYRAINDNVTSIPTNINDWEVIDGSDYVIDADISKAFLEAKTNFNSRIWGCFESSKIAFLYAVAHYLVIDRRAGGLNGTTTSDIITSASRSVGNVSESFGYAPPPPKILGNLLLAHFWYTQYGQKYLSLLGSGNIGNFIVFNNYALP